MTSVRLPNGKMAHYEAEVFSTGIWSWHAIVYRVTEGAARGKKIGELKAGSRADVEKKANQLVEHHKRVVERTEPGVTPGRIRL